MDARRYALSLSPDEAIRAFLESEHVEALREGSLSAGDGVVTGVVTATPNAVVLQAQRFGQRFSFSSPLTARVRIELEATERGSAFSLQRIPPRFTKTVEFRGVAIIAGVSAFIMLRMGVFGLASTLCVLASQFLIAGIYWLVHRRGIATVNDTLINLVWRVWAPALESQAPSMYRGPAALNP